MKEDFRLNDKNKSDISMRVVILILALMAVSYLFKMCGSETFNKFINNENFINISNFIDGNIILNMLVYGLLNYYITYFATSVSCRRVKLKIIEHLLVIFISIVFAVVRYYFYGWETYAFDFCQYIFLPFIISIIFNRKTELKSLMEVLVLYFVFNGLLHINLSLCGLMEIIYSSNLIAYILCFIEPYLFVVAYCIFSIKGEQYVKSNINIKQEERANARIQKIRK